MRVGLTRTDSLIKACYGRMIEVLKDREFMVRAEVTAVENAGNLAHGSGAGKAPDRSEFRIGRQRARIIGFLKVVEDADRTVLLAAASPACHEELTLSSSSCNNA